MKHDDIFVFSDNWRPESAIAKTDQVCPRYGFALAIHHVVDCPRASPAVECLQTSTDSGTGFICEPLADSRNAQSFQMLGRTKMPLRILFVKRLHSCAYSRAVFASGHTAYRIFQGFPEICPMLWTLRPARPAYTFATIRSIEQIDSLRPQLRDPSSLGICRIARTAFDDFEDRHDASGDHLAKPVVFTGIVAIQLDRIRKMCGEADFGILRPSNVQNFLRQRIFQYVDIPRRIIGYHKSIIP